MGTRSNIGIVHKDGSVRMNYCHWDGYLSHNGKLLLENYTTLEKVRALLDLGDISTLNESVETCIAYHRDRGEVLRPNMVFGGMDEAAANMEEYMYLFVTTLGLNKWMAFKQYDGSKAILTPEMCVR